MLPSINSPTFEVTLPISKKKVSFRPFLVKEQKVLLMAAESDDKDFLIKNIKEIIKSCCKSELDIDKLPTIDFEFLFLNLRARSVGEIIETKYRCENFVEEKGEICGNSMNVVYDILETTVETSNYNDVIKLTDSVGIKMKFPDYKTVEKMTESEIKPNTIFDVIKNCIDYIYDQDNFYYPKETTDEELNSFIESLSVEQFKRLQSYFDQLPSLEKEIQVSCDKCGFNHTILIKGIKNFFD